MISMRYHIVSLAAVFLALALGIVLGATKISSPILGDLQSSQTTLTAERDELSVDNADLEARVEGDEVFAGSVGQLAVRGTLPDAEVVVFTTADADPTDRDAVLSLLNRAGAKVTAQVGLTDALTDPSRSSEFTALATKSLPTGAKLPEGTEPGTVAAGLLGAVLLKGEEGATPVSADEASATLTALSTAGFITASDTVNPGTLVVIVTGGTVEDDAAQPRAALLTDLAEQFKVASDGVVVAGRDGSAASGAVAGIRADTSASSAVSTVDNVETASGRLAAVLALVEQNGGGVGRYGFADTAQAQVPALAVG